MKINEAHINKNFKLFECAIPVKGAKRGIIYDLQRAKFDYIPLELINILERFDGKKLNDVLLFYGNENETVILEYFEFLLREEYIFFTKLNKKYFPKLEIRHEKPYKISNIIIDVNTNTLSHLIQINEQLEDIGCESLQLRFLKHTDCEDFFLRSIKIFKNSSFKNIEIICKEIPMLNEVFLNDFCVLNMKITKFTLFESYENKVKILKPANVLLIKTKTKIKSTSKHTVHINNFMVNMDLYMESKLFNNYYNKKIYINGQGDIMNSPDNEETFGNIGNTNLKDIINDDYFKKLWEIPKDSILKCKDCEYRYMCVDSSIPYESGDAWELQEECDYDPYNARWNIKQ